MSRARRYWMSGFVCERQSAFVKNGLSLAAYLRETGRNVSIIYVAASVKSQCFRNVGSDGLDEAG